MRTFLSKARKRAAESAGRADALTNELSLPLPVEAAGSARSTRKVLFAAMKNEAPFVLEWVAYHKIIGFDRVIVVSNDCTDNTDGLLEALSAAGEIVHIGQHVPKGIAPQASAVEIVNRSGLVGDGDWCIFLDADEFLNVHCGSGRVEDLIDSLDGHEGMLINWRRFGDSGQSTFSGRYIDDVFIRAEAQYPPFTLFKTFFRKSRQMIGFSPNLHRCSLAPATVVLSEIINSAGNKVPTAKRRIARHLHASWAETGEQSWGRIWPDEMGYSIAQINHYMVRDPLSFALKGIRGRGHDANLGPNHRHTAEFYERNNRNEAEDRSISRWRDAVTAEIGRLLDLPAVASAKERSDDLIRETVAKMDLSKTVPPSGSPNDYAEPGRSYAASAFRLTMPQTEAGYLRQMYAQASVILEYGSGGSTVLAAELGKSVISVESDRAWADRLDAHLASMSSSARVHHVDIGPTEKWGMPARPRFHGRFHLYPLSVWDLPELGDPDLVLIDGRFRAACFASIILRTQRPTTVLFDDYVDRPYYHGVEKLSKLEATVGRMARFTVLPGPIPPVLSTEVMGWFSDPR